MVRNIIPLREKNPHILILIERVKNEFESIDLVLEEEKISPLISIPQCYRFVLVILFKTIFKTGGFPRELISHK